MATFKVIIIGGGLSGALLANGLLNHNIDAFIYERDAEGSNREGYQIRLGESSMTGFRACLTEAHMNSIIGSLGQSSGATATAPAIYNTRWEEIIDLAIVPTYSKSAAINRVVLRDALLAPIKEKGRINYQKAFKRYDILEEGGRERLKVTFADGSSDTCDILVGADGSGSRVNTQVGANNLVSLNSHIAFVSKGDLPRHRLQQLPARLKKGPVLLFSSKVSFYYALYLPRDDQSQTDQGPRQADLKYNENAASFYWSLWIPREEVPYVNPLEVPNALQLCMDKLEEWGWAQEL